MLIIIIPCGGVTHVKPQSSLNSSCKIETSDKQFMSLSPNPKNILLIIYVSFDYAAHGSFLWITMTLALVNPLVNNPDASPAVEGLLFFIFYFFIIMDKSH